MADFGVASTAAADALEQLIADARADIGSHWLGDAAAKEAGLGACRQAEVKLGDLRGRLAKDVLAGNLAPERWFSIAQEQWELVTSVTGYEAASSGLKAFWTGVVVKSVDDAGTLAVKAADIGLHWGPWVLGAAAVVGLLWLVRPMLVARNVASGA